MNKMKTWDAFMAELGEEIRGCSNCKHKDKAKEKLCDGCISEDRTEFTKWEKETEG
jgi:hypothetical protein